MYKQKIFLNKEELYNLYVQQNKNAKQIAEIYNCSSDTIINNLKKFDIKLKTMSEVAKKYTKNDFYFSFPTIENSYLAGWLAADSSISEIKGGQNKLTIGIKRDDEILLTRFKEKIEYTGTIKQSIKKPPKNTDKYNYKKQEYYESRLQINSANQLTYDLNKYWNITSRKSLTLKPPNITNFEQQIAYIIGYIDGDGCISLFKNHKNKNKTGYRKPYLSLNIVGTKEILEWIMIILNKLEDNKYKILSLKQKQNNKAYEINFTCKRAEKILVYLQNFITKHNLQVLDRKWNKIREYFGVLV